MAAPGRSLSQPVSCFPLGGWVFRAFGEAGITAKAVHPVPDPGKASSPGGQRHLWRVLAGPKWVLVGV